MTREEIISKAKYIQFPYANETYREKYSGFDVTRMPLVPKSVPIDRVMYVNMGDNGHHYTLDYHFRYVIPTLEKILGFNFDTSLYKWKVQEASTGDMSRWIPRKSPKFEVYEYISKSHFTTDFSGIQPVNGNDKYRSLYKYPHACSRIINYSMPENGEKLMVVGDSQSIPDIPYLAMYFREVWYFDNRTGWKVNPEWKPGSNVGNKFIPVYEDTVSYADKYKDTVFDKVLIQFYCSEPDRYLKVNLK